MKVKEFLKKYPYFKSLYLFIAIILTLITWILESISPFSKIVDYSYFWSLAGLFEGPTLLYKFSFRILDPFTLIYYILIFYLIYRIKKKWLKYSIISILIIIHIYFAYAMFDTHSRLYS